MRMLLLLAVTATAICQCQPAAAAAPSDQCDTESIQAMAPAETTVGFAAREPGGCRVGGYVTTQNPGPNRVLFTLFLPNNFNGRYLYMGVGGSAGSLPSIPPSLLAKGYALAGSDGGTGAKSGSDFSFYSNPAKALDFAWRGVRVSTAATQQITRTYFGNQNLHRYISGCSGGGAMGMSNARRFGDEQFDGFLVGATGWPGDAYLSHIYAIARYLQTHPEGWISPALLAHAQAAILEKYDASDGAVDGIIADQRNITDFDTNILRQIGFTPAQITTFEFIRQPHEYSGPGLAGKVTFPGFPITNVGSWSGFLMGTTRPPWRATNSAAPSGSVEGPPFAHLMADTNVRAIHPTLDYWSVTDDVKLVGLATNDGKKIGYPDPMDFTAFMKSGAKMIIYNGIDDPNMSYLNSLWAYGYLTQRFPAASSKVKAVMIPGLWHCRGGLGPTAPDEELLDSLVNWVEKGTEPGSIVASRNSASKAVERTFLLCAEPKRAQLKQPRLDPKSADSWTCD
jgi:feruloyl esterase